MEYKVEYDAIDSLYTTVNQNQQAWEEELQQVSLAVKAIIDSKAMSGRTADSIRQYAESVHQTIIGLFYELIALHAYNVLLYKQDYYSNVDSKFHAKIHTDVLDNIANTLENQIQLAKNVDGEVRDTLQRISDIFRVSYRGVDNVVSAQSDAIDCLQSVNRSVDALETQHSMQDFGTLEELITSLRHFMEELAGQNRSFISNFSPTNITALSSFRAIYDASVKVEKQLDEKSEAIKTALDSEDARIAEILEEYEERQKTAKWINIGVTVVCVVGSAAVIVVSGGTATPLAIGAISAASSAVMAGTSNLTAQYVEQGNLVDNYDKIDWGDFGKDVCIGSATGFVTGYLGATVGAGITNAMGNTSLGSTLLNSSSTLTRVGTGAVIGSVSEVTSGIITRGAAATVEGVLESNLDSGEILNQMFDGKSIVIDAAIGGVIGGVGAIKKPKDHIDWENTSNSDEELDILREMEDNGEFDIDGEDYGTPTEPTYGKKHLPTDSTGVFSGERGNSEFTPNNKNALERMREYGRESVTYKNNDVDFSPFTNQHTEWGDVDCTVEIGHMTDTRSHTFREFDPGNFEQADMELADKISEQTGKIVTKTDLKKYRTEKKLTWHEVPDGKTMQLIPSEIHEACPHSGGVSEMKYRMSWGDITKQYENKYD